MNMKLLDHHKNYWVGFIGTAMIGSLLNALQSRIFSFVVDLLLGLVVILLISMVVGLVVSTIKFFFTKKFSLLTTIKSATIICFIIAITQLISMVPK